tara:strand:- start:705 stop:1013 length:309 start_codon:yes stop_codon:yes gene_type:complete
MSDEPKADVINFLERKARYAENKILRIKRLPPPDAEVVTINDIGILKIRDKMVVVLTQSDYGGNPPCIDTVTFDADELPSVIQTLIEAHDFILSREEVNQDE